MRGSVEFCEERYLANEAEVMRLFHSAEEQLISKIERTIVVPSDARQQFIWHLYFNSTPSGQLRSLISNEEFEWMIRQPYYGENPNEYDRED